MIVHYESAKVTKPFDGITRRVLASSRDVMLTEHLLKEGAVLPEHNHPHEQLVYLLSGELLLEIDGQQMTMISGDSVVVPSDAPHKATANKACRVLDIFVPAREDYR
jgi:quercetin dioxygenase-like cupin family protein